MLARLENRSFSNLLESLIQREKAGVRQQGEEKAA